MTEAQRTQSVFHLVFALLIIFLGRIAAAYWLPVMRDEAYYAAWADRLTLGYLDHPPVIAWSAALVNWLPGSPFALRSGTIFFALASLLVLWSIVKKISPQATWKSFLLVGVLTTGNLAGIAVGILSTPDAALGLCWLLALNEGLAAVAGNQKRWLTAGAAVGLGLWAKYHMVLMALIFFGTLWQTNRAALRTRWPWLGVALTVLTIAPHLAWNAQNHWLTLKFQFAHGFGLDRTTIIWQAVSGKNESSSAMATHGLVHPLPNTLGSAESLLIEEFRRASGPETPKKTTKKREKPPSWQAAGQRLLDFLGANLALWGALLIPLGGHLWQSRRNLTTDVAKENPHQYNLLIWATLTPLVFFGIICTFSKSEANWAAMYLIGAALLAGTKFPNLAERLWRSRALAIGAVVNVGLVAALSLHARYHVFGDLLGAAEGEDRLINETAGYPQLADWLMQQPKSKRIFTDTYQNMSVVRFMNPNLSIFQWPGISRPSEFSVNRSWYPDNASNHRFHEFAIFTDQGTPPRIPGYFAYELVELRYCGPHTFEVITASSLQRQKPHCSEPWRSWRFASYAPFDPND